MPDSPNLHSASALVFDPIHKAAGGQGQHDEEPVAQPLAECRKHLGRCCPWFLVGGDAPSAEIYAERHDAT